MPQKQVRNVFKEKLGPEELTPSCLPQELSRFPGFCFFFFIFVFKHVVQFHSYSDGANPLAHGAGEKQTRRAPLVRSLHAGMDRGPGAAPWVRPARSSAENE